MISAPAALISYATDRLNVAFRISHVTEKLVHLALKRCHKLAFGFAPEPAVVDSASELLLGFPRLEGTFPAVETMQPGVESRTR
jgi:hypothetical protein